jgi:hypothetical protein
MYQHTWTYYPNSLYFYLQLPVIFLHLSFVQIKMTIRSGPFVSRTAYMQRHSLE